MYIVCSWPDAGALPIVFTVQPILDGVLLAVNNVTIGPVAPVAPGDGDTWLDTSGTDTNLGNASRRLDRSDHQQLRAEALENLVE
jgi:hypothetical protein